VISNEGVELQGRPAAAGIAAGPLIVLGDSTLRRVFSGSIEIEKQDFDSAVASAAQDLSRLIAQVEVEGRDMLAFQLAFLEDETLRTRVIEAIASSIAADAAWQKVLDGEISGYREAGDEYFRARASDLKDLRDRVLRHLQGGSEISLAPGAVVAGDEVGPTLFLEMDWSNGGGLLLTAGSASSHVAMLARARGVPMVVGLGQVNFEGHAEAVIDGETGRAILSPSNAQRNHYLAKLAIFDRQRNREKAFLREPARSKDGVRIDLLINVAGIEEIDQLDSAVCDGIGLMRTEFLFRDGMPLPDEEQQYAVYCRLLEWAGRKPVTIRTLDLGGDKPVRGLTSEMDKNPFLGVRGVRLTLARSDVFRSQLKALARAAFHGNLKVMLPMVAVAEEIRQSSVLLDEIVAELRAKGVACARPPLGIMVEVPAVAVAPELYDEAAFFSIGSNDLTQYVMAAARDEPAVSHLSDPEHPAVLKLIAAVVQFGRQRNIPVSLCGDMASEPRHLHPLLRTGLRSISVAPAAIGRVKAALSEMVLSETCPNR
jgi:phosphoenolpyruvate-protein phosphotransferase (PTS system enzyme I)